jgi:glycine hydroxymethyltransferase
LIDRAVFPGLQGGPHNHQTAAIAVALEEALRPTFIKYQTQIVKNAKKLAEELQNCGFKLYTNGTDNHLLLIDLKSISPRQSVFDSLSGFALPNGKEAEKILEEANITANRNFLPGDNYNNPTGLRLGTPAITTRGMKEKEMIKIANWIKELLINKKTPAIIKKEILKLLEKFPLQ